MGSLTFVFSFTCWEGLEERDWPLSSVTYFDGKGGEEGVNGNSLYQLLLVCAAFLAGEF